MTELDTELGPLALELIEEFGKLVVFETMGLGVYDVATATNAIIPVKVECKAFPEDYSLIGSGQGYATGLIEIGDKKLTVAALSFSQEPTSSDKVLFNGVKYNVVNVKAIYSGELACLYEIQARKG